MYARAINLIVTYLSYGLVPHICAALFTSHVKFKLKTYRKTHCEENDQKNDSFQKYIGITVGKKKHSNNFSGMKYLVERHTENIIL